MKLYIVTHGQHQKGGNTAETYDGPLTEKGIADLEAIKEQVQEIAADYPDCRIFHGPMLRHEHAARVLGVLVNSSGRMECLGNDADIFTMPEDGGDRLIANVRETIYEWLPAIQGHNGRPPKSVLLIASRGMGVAMRYIQGGGAEKFGKFLPFLTAYEDAVSMPGAYVPVMAQAAITEWEI